MTKQNVIDLGEDNGYTTIVIDGSSYSVDIFHLNNRLFEENRRRDEEGSSLSDFYSSVVKILTTEFGLPTMSHCLASNLIKKVNALVGELEKKAE